MKPDTEAALHQAAFDLRAMATRAQRSATNFREQAEAYERTALGHIEAAILIEAAITNEAAGHTIPDAHTGHGAEGKGAGR